MMEAGYKKIFWGFLITIFNINLGPINILPDFIGYYIMGFGISKIYEEYQDQNLKSANTLANILMSYSLIIGIVEYSIINNIIGGGLYEHPAYIIINFILTTLVNAVILVMIFKIISGTIDLYLNREMNDEVVALIDKQRRYTILSIIGLLLTTIVPNISNEYFILAMAVYIITIYLYFAVIVSNIRKTVTWDSGGVS